MPWRKKPPTARSRAACFLRRSDAMMRVSLGRQWLIFTAFLAACGQSPTGGSARGPVPASSNGAAPPGSNDPPADDPPRAPAKPSSVPQIGSYGGDVMSSPRVVPIVFQGDPLASRIRAFVDRLGASDYWRATTAEYGVGPALAGATVTVTEPAPKAVSSDEVTAWLAQHLDGSHAGWGSADEDAVYAIFYPSGTSITAGSDSSCVTFGGYHGDTQAGSRRIVYAVLPRCAPPAGMSTLDYLTVALSHELVEAATDPHPSSAPAYAMADADHFVWGLVLGGELGDMCTYPFLTTRPSDLGFLVQRTWSNASAAAGRHPCVPQPEGSLYFNSVPELDETVTLDLGQGVTQETKGLRLAVGQSTTVQVRLFADAPSSREWTVHAGDLSAATGGPKELSFVIEPSSGKSGDVLRMNITRLRRGAVRGGTDFMLLSTSGDEQNVWVGFAAN